MDYTSFTSQAQSQAQELAIRLVKQPLAEEVKDKLIKATQSSYPTGPIKFEDVVRHIEFVNTVPVCKIGGVFLEVAVLEKKALLFLSYETRLIKAGYVPHQSALEQMACEDFGMPYNCSDEELITVHDFLFPLKKTFA